MVSETFFSLKITSFAASVHLN